MAGTTSSAVVPDDVPPAMSVAALARADDEFLRGRPPGQHFRHRLRLLMQALEQDASQPVTQGRLTLLPEDDEPHVFVHLEAVPLLHQAAEAAWSLLYAVGPGVSSPSLYLAQLTTQQLKSRIDAARAEPDALDSLIRHALLLDPSASHADPGYRESGEQRLPAVRRLLRLAAARLDDDRRINNAIKHGFAVTAPRAEIGFSLTDPRSAPDQDPDLELGRAAIWLSVLEKHPKADRDGTKRWRRSLTALDDLDQEFWLILMLTYVLDALRACARARRHTHDGPPLSLRLPTDSDIDNLNDRPANLIRRITFDDLYTDREGIITMTGYA